MATENVNWTRIVDDLPRENVVVKTKIDDKDGCRNEQELVYWCNRWWYPSKEMYVYYTPTHWRY